MNSNDIGKLLLFDSWRYLKNKNMANCAMSIQLKVLHTICPVSVAELAKHSTHKKSG